VVDAAVKQLQHEGDVGGFGQRSQPAETGDGICQADGVADFVGATAAENDQFLYAERYGEVEISLNLMFYARMVVEIIEAVVKLLSQGRR